MRFYGSAVLHGGSPRAARLRLPQIVRAGPDHSVEITQLLVDNGGHYSFTVGKTVYNESSLRRGIGE